MTAHIKRVLGWCGAAIVAGSTLGAWGAVFSGGMVAVTAFVLLTSLVPLIGALGLVVGAVLAIRRRALSGPIAVSLGASAIALWPVLWNFGIAMITFPSRLDRARPVAHVRLPSNERLRVAWGGDSVRVNQHAATPDQRWAYDLVVEPYFVDSQKLEDFGCWNTDVVAPATARVHGAVDGRPDVTPGVISAEQPLGNHVVLALDSGTFLVLAHLQRGSVQVKAGDTAREGQLLGRCGNSGHTSEPHIHIHHQRQDPLEYPVNFAEGLPLYFRDHGGPRMPEGGLVLSDGRPIARGAQVQHRASAAR